MSPAVIRMASHPLLGQMTVRAAAMAAFVHQCSGAVDFSEAAQALGISKPAVTRAVDALERAAMVERLPHPTDRRRVLLAGTPQLDDAMRALAAA